MVDVTTEALQTVKNALGTFQSDINGISMRATNNADEITEECKNHLKQTKAEIAQVEAQIATLNKQIADLEARIEQSISQYNALLARIPQLENNIRSLNSRISALNSQIASLRSQLANTDDDDERQQIQEQINADAKKILAEINKLDEKLSSVDKYYVKTKKKKEELLSDTTSDAYDDATDYFKTLGKIKDSFKVLYKKYSEDILPGLINGLNYLFSSQRKKDYEELIILRNTVAAFVKEIEEMLPPLTEENLAALKEDYFTQRGSMVERQKNEAATFESNHSATLDKVADKICTDLDNVLPDEFVDYLCTIMANYAKVVHKVNASSEIQDEVLNMCYVDYPVDFFVQSKIVASIIKEKCSKILVNGAIRLPIMMSTRNAPVWMIANDNSNSSMVQAFTHSIMYGLLSSCPVEKLTFTIVDPENRGNSISPFFDAKKKLPELFGEKIYISKDEVAAKVSKLNEKIENILQDRLGNQSS